MNGHFLALAFNVTHDDPGKGGVRCPRKKRAARGDRPCDACLAADASVLGFDPLAVGHFALVDSQAEAALGVRANPRLENDRSAFLAIVRKWNKSAIVTLLALRQLHHTTPPVRPASSRPTQKLSDPTT